MALPIGRILIVVPDGFARNTTSMFPRREILPTRLRRFRKETAMFENDDGLLAEVPTIAGAGAQKEKTGQGEKVPAHGVNGKRFMMARTNLFQPKRSLSFD